MDLKDWKKRLAAVVAAAKSEELRKARTRDAGPKPVLTGIGDSTASIVGTISLTDDDDWLKSED